MLPVYNEHSLAIVLMGRGYSYPNREDKAMFNNKIG